MDEGIVITLSREELKGLIQEAIAEYNNSFNTKSDDEQQVEQLLKIDDVCALLNVSKVTIHKWKKEGKIPYHRISNRIFFKESEILESLESIYFNQKEGSKL